MNKPDFKSYIQQYGVNKYIEQFEKYLDESKDDQIAIIELLNIYIKTRCYLKYEKLFNSAYERFPSNAILNRVHGKYLLFCKNKFLKLDFKLAGFYKILDFSSLAL